jgi:glycoside/pentoside/hexuronide:cation symporter, GPH family
MKKTIFITTRKERYSLYLLAFGAAVFNSVLGLFSNYLTDIGLTAATVSIILLVTRVWDFVNDPLAGSIIEKAKFKSGKYIPWLRFSTIFLPIFGIIMFAVPASLPVWLKIILTTLLYVLFEAVFNFLDIPIFGIRLVTTNQVQERTDLASFIGLYSLLGLLIGFVLFPQVRTALGWGLTALIFGLFAMITMIWYPYVAKERFNIKSTDPSVKDMIRAVIKNKQLMIFYASLLICMSTNYLQVIGLFVSRYVFGNEQFMSLLLLAILVPSFLAALFIPTLTKFMDKFTLFRVSLLGFAITGVISYFVGYSNLTLVLIFSAIRGVFVGVSSLLAYSFTPDMVEWEHYHSGERSEAVSFSFQTFTAKAITALLSVTMMAILSVLGFASGEGVTQSLTVVTGIWAMFTWIPSVGTLISLIGFQFYKIRDKKVQVMIRHNHGEIDRETAETELEKLGGY